MHPYRDLPDRSFWKRCAAAPDFARERLYTPSFPILPGARIATAGSCFAQHLGWYLRGSAAELLDVEPAPRGMRPDTARRFGYGLFSARYGNVYSARQLRQLLEDAGDCTVHADAIWRRGTRYWDALRPGVEPEGLESAEEVAAHRREHLARVQAMLRRTEIFIFTLGLTETWIHRNTGRAYPLAPGVIAGRFDPSLHEFVNADYPAVLSDLEAIRGQLRARSPDMKIVLTVSPVALSATATREHVLAATVYSKSVLRAAAGAMATRFDDVDYVPTFEVIAGAPSAGRYLADDMREVTPDGVEAAMRMFFAGQPGLAPSVDADLQPSHPLAGIRPPQPDPESVICEERLLGAFQ